MIAEGGWSSLDLHKGSEEQELISGRNSYACVPDFDSCVVSVRASADANATAIWREFDGVRQQIDEHLRNSLPIDAYGRQFVVAVYIQGNVAVVCLPANQGTALADQTWQVSAHPV